MALSVILDASNTEHDASMTSTCIDRISFFNIIINQKLPQSSVGLLDFDIT